MASVVPIGPEGVPGYSLQNVVGDVVGILAGLGIGAADIVGHDWGAAAAWFLAAMYPGRVRKLLVLSVPHPFAPRRLRQREMAWYQLFFQFEGIAEAWLQHENWALFREMLRGNGDVDRYISDLSRPGALTASLNWYRATVLGNSAKAIQENVLAAFIFVPTRQDVCRVTRSQTAFPNGSRRVYSGVATECLAEFVRFGYSATLGTNGHRGTRFSILP